jgi:hypothetical protein
MGLLTAGVIGGLFGGCRGASEEPAPDADAPTRRFLNTHLGYTFDHPAAYDTAVVDENGIALYQGSLLNVEAPRVDVVVEPGRGRDAATIADQIAESFPDAGIQRTEMTLGGQPAVRLDGVPGQDLSRVVVAVYNERLHQLTFRPLLEGDDARMAELDALYDAVTSSYAFDPAP